jgi:thiol-disulfide isomerase/thioredoxin
VTQPLGPGAEAPPIPGADSGPGPRALLFYKVTCPTCQLAGPVAERLARELPGDFLAVGQDPPERLEEFRATYGDFPATTDTDPYPVSDAYGIRTVPTLFVLHDGRVDLVVESWDREGWNRAAERLGQLAGRRVGPLSEVGDGLPPFRPG